MSNKSSNKSSNKYWGGVLLIAGTCIGAGMIGVPVKTAVSGFVPTLMAFMVVWTVMLFSALLFLEASMAFPGEVNFISMSKEILGNIGKNIAWLVTLLYMYSIMASYTSGGGSMIAQLFSTNKVTITIVLYLIPFILLLYFGSKWVDFINRFFTIGLIVSFIILCVSTLVGARSLQPISNFTVNGSLYDSCKFLILALPLLVTTFGHHVIIPSLKFYLEENAKLLQKTIIIGSTLPLVVYVIWQVVILLLIPAFGPEGLSGMLVSNKNPGDSITAYLLKYGQNKIVVVSLASFMFCALSSSFIGVSWALNDFLADGFKIVKNNRGKMLLILLTFLPPMLYALCFPQGFLRALGISGVFASIIMIMYPALMVYKLRKSHKLRHLLISRYKTPINNIFIIIIILFGLIIAFLEFIN